jgi:dsDNA-binding SOS-regulon protein
MYDHTYLLVLGGAKLKEEKKGPSEISFSVKDMEIFQMMLEYTKVLIEILEEYPLSEEDNKKLNEISKEFFEFKMDLES